MKILQEHPIDYIEIYTPMAKVLAYWHIQALGFKLLAVMNPESGSPGISSYVLRSHEITLVLTSTYPPYKSEYNEISSFIAQNYCGVKRIALRVPSVKEAFDYSISNGAFPIKFPTKTDDDSGYLEEAAIKLYDHSELVFIDRTAYEGVFKPGYKASLKAGKGGESLLKSFDHIAAEVRINESHYWTSYLSKALGTSLVQSIERGADNKTGMILSINQSADKKLTLVIAEPDGYEMKSKVQQNIDAFGPGIHHLAFSTDNLVETAKSLEKNNVDFVSFPPSYYELLRKNDDFKDIDIDELQRMNILCDKEDDTYLFQKFIKPISDRPFFIYEIVQRINGYNGFALKNINVLKKAEELEIMKAV
ncbi:4-hydroxyphenylpyruvate dioxygenase [Pedobacter steynii]|uniref:4-hydroxyphenylpyruvate dioxygenase n=1 Tax=Pedobacter steynii TaxID=430522 RepID=A0A1G9V977_9SPHI|nr:VOC family protein [Pedobacter steynii]NQX41020.1 Long-chain-fatty-acid--CoA ligase [Pedobacter steynii]SDM68719.1 4-hydroxyphenylpyruvate dioxygenase [Pedobacter steynii]